MPVRKGDKWGFYIQEHFADRAGRHLDLRLVDNKGRAFSWALKGDLPKPGEKHLVVEQPVHTAEYAGWEGVIPLGYGKGSVSLKDKSEIDILESGPDRVTFVIPRGKIPEEYTMIRVSGKNWLLVNHSTTPGKYPFKNEKPPYKSMEYGEVPIDNPDQVISAKIGGAHAVVILEKGKRPRLFSYRQSVRGLPLEYTHKMPIEFRVTRWEGPSMMIRGEVWGVDKDTGKAIPETQLGGILNATVDKAREMMAMRNIELRLAPFMVSTLQGKPFSGGYDQHLELLRQVEKNLPKTKIPPLAMTPEQKARMLKAIESGGIPETSEGVVLWDRKDPNARPVKAKIAPDFDVYVRKVFMEKGQNFPKKDKPKGFELTKDPMAKYKRRFRMPDGSIRYEYEEARPAMAGGFYYSLTPRGPIVGKVGTGLSFEMKKDMAQNPEKYEGLVARVRALAQYPSGALAKPSFKNWHFEKSFPRKTPDER